MYVIKIVINALGIILFVAGFIFLSRHLRRKEVEWLETIQKSTPKWATFSTNVPANLRTLATKSRYCRDRSSGWKDKFFVSHELPRHTLNHPNRVSLINYSYCYNDVEGENATESMQIVLIETIEHWPEIFIQSKALNFGTTPVLTSSCYEVYLKPNETIEREFAGLILDRLESKKPMSFTIESFSDSIVLCVHGERYNACEPDSIPVLLQLGVDLDSLGQKFLKPRYDSNVVQAEVFDPRIANTNITPVNLAKKGKHETE